MDAVVEDLNQRCVCHALGSSATSRSPCRSTVVSAHSMCTDDIYCIRFRCAAGPAPTASNRPTPTQNGSHTGMCTCHHLPQHSMFAASDYSSHSCNTQHARAACTSMISFHECPIPENISGRRPVTQLRPVLVVNLDVRDSAEEAAVAAPQALRLCTMVRRWASFSCCSCFVLHMAWLLGLASSCVGLRCTPLRTPVCVCLCVSQICCPSRYVLTHCWVVFTVGSFSDANAVVHAGSECLCLCVPCVTSPRAGLLSPFLILALSLHACVDAKPLPHRAACSSQPFQTQ